MLGHINLSSRILNEQLKRCMMFDEDCLVETGPELTREEYEARWYKRNREDRAEMRILIPTLLFKHAKDDEEYCELLEKLNSLFEDKPEPIPIDPSYRQEEDYDNHFHHSIGNKLLCEENFWGAGGIYRIHKLYSLNSPCLNMLFNSEE